MQVIDNDPFEDDHVDDIYIDRTLSTSSSFTPYQTYIGDYGNSRIELTFRVHCDPHFYGSHCSQYCVDTDNVGGHYTCDRNNGNRICLPGWTSHTCTIGVYTGLYCRPNYVVMEAC